MFECLQLSFLCLTAVLPGELKQSFADAVKQPEKVAQVKGLSFDVLPLLPPVINVEGQL